MIYQDPEDQKPYKDFEKMVRSLAPSVPATDEHRHQLRATLQGRLKQRSRRHRAVFLSTLIIALVFVFGYQSEVGSDGFELQRTSQTISGKPVFESVFGEKRVFNDTQDMSETAQREFSESIYAHKQAKQNKLVAVTGWTISGHTFFYSVNQYVIDGVIKEVGNVVSPLEQDVAVQYLEFSSTYEATFRTQISEGTAEYLGIEAYDVSGVRLMFKKWSLTSPEMGEVVYWEADVPD